MQLAARMSSRRALLLVALIIALASLLRLYGLDARPPHHDEAVNGWFVEQLSQRGYYVYDPTNYHGPSYFYLLGAAREALGFGLWQLRFVTALVGIALCLLPLLLHRQLGMRRVIAASALLATSPTLVYYARYAIHETLLAALGLLASICILRAAHGRRLRWWIVASAAIAAMIATKETTIIFLAVGGLWLAGETVVESIRRRQLTVLGLELSLTRRFVVGVAAALAVAVAIHVLMFTGFFQTPGSLSAHLERSLRAYFVWGETGTGETGHAKAVCYYVHHAVRYELVLYLLAVVGLIAAFRNRVVRGTGLVGLGMMAVYSLIPYKMPWLPASWLVLLAIPAGQGIAVLARALADEISPRLGKAALVLAIVPALAVTVRSSFLRAADPHEELAYVPTLPGYTECMTLVELGARRVGRDALTIGFGHEMQWPFAWSLLPYRGTRWSVAGDEDIVIVAASKAAEIQARLRGAYFRRDLALRDSSEPAAVYLKRSVFEPRVARR